MFMVDVDKSAELRRSQKGIFVKLVEDLLSDTFTITIIIIMTRMRDPRSPRAPRQKQVSSYLTTSQTREEESNVDNCCFSSPLFHHEASLSWSTIIGALGKAAIF
jgi:hypothetical protein